MKGILSMGLSDFTARLKWSPNESVVHRGAFPPLDLGLVVRVVLSLFVVLLVYDTVCGEKEAGTLRLVSSFPVSRHGFLIGKLLGTLMPILASVVLPSARLLVMVEFEMRTTPLEFRDTPPPDPPPAFERAVLLATVAFVIVTLPAKARLLN